MFGQTYGACSSRHPGGGRKRKGPAMIFGTISGFIMPGYATRALTRSEQCKLVERFMSGDFGVATMSELAANEEAFKRGGEVVGRYLFKAHEWILWGRVAAPGTAPDHEPGLLLHAMEYRDGWHRGPEHMKVGDDHPHEWLIDKPAPDEPRVTIMAPANRDGERGAPRYWIPINGSSCALSAIPWVNPTVTPTPQQLFGFLTLEEARKAQHICLTAPIPEVKAFFDRLRPDVEAGRIVHRRPERPDPRVARRPGWRRPMRPSPMRQGWPTTRSTAADRSPACRAAPSCADRDSDDTCY
jgi:hypothetical protein